MSLEIPIILVDRYGAPLGKLDRSLESVRRKTDRIQKSSVKGYGDMGRSLSDLRGRLERYKRGAEESFNTRHIKRYNALIGETQKRIQAIERETKTCSQTTEGMFGKLKSNFGMGTGSFAMMGGAMLGRKAVQVASQSIADAASIEKYSVTLKTMLGSSSAARDRMQEYFDIAAKTPFQLDQVVEAGNKLQAIGRYSKDNLNMLGDLAAASGKPMEQALGAYSKMATGQKGIAIDMFRDLLISTDDWVAATGKGKSKTGELLATTGELIAALPKIMRSKGYLGMMAEQAATTEGRVSNLKDAYFQLSVAVGDRLKPGYDGLVQSTTSALEKLQGIAEIPLARKIMKEKVELNMLVDTYRDANTSLEARATIMETLQTKYPEIIKNIDLEKLSTEQLRKEMEGVNAAYDKKMRKAALERRTNALDTAMGETMDDIVAYEISLRAAADNRQIRGPELNKWAKENGITSNGSPWYKLESYALNPDMVGTPLADSARELYDRFKANEELKTFWGLDKEKLEAAQRKYNIYNAQRETIVKQIDKEFPISSTDPYKNSGGSGSSGATGAGGSYTPLAGTVETIASGGKNIKNFHITIGNILGENTNYFSSSSDNIESSGDFVSRLATALTSIVNDVNYE